MKYCKVKNSLTPVLLKLPLNAYIREMVCRTIRTYVRIPARTIIEHLFECQHSKICSIAMGKRYPGKAVAKALKGVT